MFTQLLSLHPLLLQPAYLRASKRAVPHPGPVDVLFFSGGKDSYLAILEMLQSVSKQVRACNPLAQLYDIFILPQALESTLQHWLQDLVLLTTYDPDMGMNGLQKASTLLHHSGP